MKNGKIYDVYQRENNFGCLVSKYVRYYAIRSRMDGGKWRMHIGRRNISYEA